MRLVVWIAITVACGGTPAPTTPTPEPVPVAAAPVLERLQPGDISCYLIVRSPEGVEVWHDAHFDVCPGGPKDATPLIGQPVVFEMGQFRVLAPSCEGNPDCAESEMADLIVGVTRAP